jgi:putative DNA primase/helicase
VSVGHATGISEEILEDLEGRRQWVVWQEEEIPGRDKPTKVLYSPRKALEGKRVKADSTDPATWADYQDAMRAHTVGGYDGVGFVFSPEDPFAGVDLDDCRDPETGELDAWAEEIVAELDSYTEISPSGKGVHIIVRGKLPPGRRGWGDGHGLYDAGRYFTMTGKRLSSTPATINKRQRELFRLHRRLFGTPKTSERPNGRHGRVGEEAVAGDDQELIERALRATNGEKFRLLWTGEWEAAGYSSHSEADLAFCSMVGFWTGPDEARIDRLLRESGLYRDKWERGDYRERTIRAALARAEFYRPTGSATTHPRTPAEEEPATGAGEDPPSPNGRGTGEAFGRFNLTDLGNSERFVADHGEDVRYCYPWGKWLVWSGARWERDDSGKAHKLAKETVRGIYREAADAEDEGRRKELAKHATRSEAEAKIRAMLELAKSELPVSPEELDANPMLLNTENGTVDLRFGALREHRREDLITKIAPVPFDPDAAAPAWEGFLERVLPSEDLREFVRRASGYSATGDTSEQVMFINHGAGNNGKSTFQEALAAALGDYSMRAPTEMLMAKRSGGVPNDVARLKGARFVTASETEEGRRLAESLVKDLTGQDTISARFMRAEFFDFRPTHKLWLSTNHKPEIRGTDNAIWRRIRLVPWAVTVPPAERDRKLPNRLRRELPGILAWIVRGCMEWHRTGLRVPDEVRRATGEYRAEMDVLAGFLEECCVVRERERSYSRELYAAYKRWSEDSGERPESQKRLAGRLSERGFLNDRDSRTGRMMWFGLSLKDEWRPNAEGSLNLSNAQFAGNSEASEGSEPKNDISARKNTSRGIMSYKGSEGSEGSADEELEGPERNPGNSQTHPAPVEEAYEPSEEEWAEFRDLFDTEDGGGAE